MTRKEKIQKELDSKTREEKLDKMRESMWNWDTETLIDTTMTHIGDNMGELCDSDFDNEYYEWFSHEFEDSYFDDDEEQQSVVEAIPEAPLKCVCGSGGSGCSDYCDLVTGKYSPGAY